MVRNKILPVSVKDDGNPIHGPIGNRHPQKSRHQDGYAAAKAKLEGKFEVREFLEQPKEKRPPKPAIEQDLIDLPNNPSARAALNFILGKNWHVGQVRMMPDGTMAKPRLQVLPKAIQGTPFRLIAGQLLGFIIFWWTIVGIWYELDGDERILAQLGDPELYIPNASYDDALAEAVAANITESTDALYVTAWVNTSYSGPIIYTNFTCMRPVRCDSPTALDLHRCASQEEGGVDNSDVTLLENYEWLAKGGAVFGNRSSANFTPHYFPWYPNYKFLHDGYNWAQVVRTGQTETEADTSSADKGGVETWTPEVDEWGEPTNPEDQVQSQWVKKKQ